MKKVRVDIGHKSYEVTVEMLGGTEAAATPAPQPVVPKPLQTARPPEPLAPATSPSSPHTPAAPGTVVSPLAGKVVEISVAVGDQVGVGASVATVEAMKMNTYVHATAAGRVAEVFARAGDSVQEGSAILRLE